MPYRWMRFLSLFVAVAVQAPGTIASSSERLNQPGNLIDLPHLRLTPSGKPALKTSPIAPQESPAGPDAEIQDSPLRLEIQRSQRRVVVYQGETIVKTYPIAVGRPGWETPIGTHKVQQKIKNPTWVNPLRKGVVIPGGDPENPLGRFWIGFWTNGRNWIGFHGTPNPESVGRAASHGCIRMYNRDIEELFQKVKLGTEVKVVK